MESLRDDGSLVVVDALPEDLSAIADLYATEAVTAHTFDEQDDELVADLRAHFEHKAARLPERLADPTQTLLVARLGGIVAGTCASIEPGRLHSMYVASPYQGLAIGSRLVRASLDRLEKPDEATVNVAMFNEPARRFYERNGFYDTGATTGHWRLASGRHITEAIFQYSGDAREDD